MLEIGLHLLGNSFILDFSSPERQLLLCICMFLAAATLYFKTRSCFQGYSENQQAYKAVTVHVPKILVRKIAHDPNSLYEKKDLPRLKKVNEGTLHHDQRSGKNSSNFLKVNESNWKPMDMECKKWMRNYNLFWKFLLLL